MQPKIQIQVAKIEIQEKGSFHVPPNGKPFFFLKCVMFKMCDTLITTRFELS